MTNESINKCYSKYQREETFDVDNNPTFTTCPGGGGGGVERTIRRGVGRWGMGGMEGGGCSRILI
jgi:hypothetical protein